jgi:hypothetical protein
MLDLLAAIVSADPPSILAWLVLAFAAGMYPVGIMLGSNCSPCCCSGPCTTSGNCSPGCACVGGQCVSNACGQCTEGELPDTLTVTFSGLQTQCCGDYYNGLSVVVKRLNYGSGNACRYSHRLCGVGNIRGNVGQIEVVYNGPTTPPTVVLTSELANTADPVSSACNAVFTASGNVTNCSDWSGVSFSASGGATATVSAGGEYDPLFRNPGGLSCFICCKGDEEVPTEIEVQLLDKRQNPPVSLSGTYVMNGSIRASGPTSDRLVTLVYSGGAPQAVVTIAFIPCSLQSPTSFLPYADGCDYCHSRCRIVGGINLGAGGTEAYYSDWSVCGGCEQTPLCVTGGRSLSLCDASGANCPFEITT